MTIETGALEQAYAKVEASYGVPDSLVATDAIRHLDLAINGKNNREESPEKRGTPDVFQLLPRRKTAGFNLSAAMWEPSGTLGTVSNLGKFIKGAMGAQHTISGGLATTVAAGTPTATGCDLTDATGLQVGDIIVVEMPDGTREATRVKTLSTVSITFDELSAAPDVGADVVSGITYTQASTITDYFSIFKYYNGGGFKQAVYGAICDQMQVMFDGTKEVGLTFQGPAAEYADSTEGTVQAKPASHTTVGNPLGGMVGNFHVGANSFLVISANVSLANNLELRNKELGTSRASGIAGRTNRRQVRVQVTFYLEDTRLIDMANAITSGTLRLVIGDTNGSMVACVMPNVEFEIPDIGSEIGPKEVTIDGIAKAVSGNDALFLAEL